MHKHSLGVLAWIKGSIYLMTKSTLILTFRIVEKVNKAVTKYRRLASLDLRNHKGRLDYYFDLGSASVGNGNRN